MVSLMHVSFTHITLTSALNTVAERVAQKRYNRPLTVFTPNTEQLLQARNDKLFLTALQTADVRVPDTIGLVKADWWRAFVTGRLWQLRERVAGVDLAESILTRAARRGWRVCLVGGMDNLAGVAANQLKNRLRGLDVVAVEAGEIRVQGTGDREQGTGDRVQGTGDREQGKEIVAQINALRPDVLLIGFGAPKQEFWAQQHKDELNTQVVMVVGGAIDIWAGKIKRAPRWMRTVGLEWLWRLVQEPWRITRQWRLVQFAWLVLRGKWD